MAVSGAFMFHKHMLFLSRYFTWANDKFPNPEEMVNHIAVKGRKMVNIVDPHLKRDDNYKIYKEAKDKDYLVKKDGGEYDGWCWPGKVNLIGHALTIGGLVLYQ